MMIGTKSILFGAHQFLIHPIFVAIAWWKLYGIPLDPRLWMCFLLHDIGYWGCPNMDGKEGERHTRWAADVMSIFGNDWFNLCHLHSRFLARKLRRNPSKLCMADKLSTVLEPWWLYLPRVILTNEIREYMAVADTKHKDEPIANDKGVRFWFRSVQKYLDYWAYEHRNEG